MAFRGLHDTDPLDPSILVLQDRHRSHLVDTEQVCILLLINYYFQLYHVIYIYSIVNLVSSLLVVPGSTLPSPTNEILHQYVEDGSTYSSIHDSRRILWYILVGPHHDRLATYHLSR